MEKCDRGKIRNREYAKQLRDFSGLRWGNITPTDIDMFIEFNNELFIYAEGKHGKTKLPYGQRLALERQHDAIEKAGINVYTFIVETNDDMINDDGDIDYSKAIIREYRWNSIWHFPKGEITILDAINKLRKDFNIK